MLSTKRKLLTVALGAILAVAVIGGCTRIGGRTADDLRSGEESAGEHGTGGEGGGEHGAGGESGSEGGGEESGATLTLDQTVDTVRNGARLILRYDKATNTFIGTVENTTNAMLQQVRVEVHLSNGTELGPTTPRDLAAGRMMDVPPLDATGESFTTWSAHAEVGPQSGGGEGGGEHGSGGEGGGEHGSGSEGG